MSSKGAGVERMDVRVFAKAEEAARVVAAEIAELIRRKAESGAKAVLGLATGSTPLPVYRELVRLHREEGLCFGNVVTFNLDEYYGLPENHPQSYHQYMRRHLFGQVDIPQEQVHVPSGMVDRAEVFDYCADYEREIEDAGGLDYQILGIGRTGHIGFNEPGSTIDSKTRLVELDPLTRKDAAGDFMGEANVPRYAITMGVETIRKAGRVVLMAWGQAKSEVIRKAVEEPPTENLPASFLQGHPDVRFFIDAGASKALTRLKPLQNDQADQT